MSQLRYIPFLICIYLLTFQPSTIESYPRIQRIVINGHEWTVPNEAGWEDVLREAEAIRSQLLSNCATSRECRLAAERLREVFLKHPISSKYYDDSVGNNIPENKISSIFKWG